MCFLVFEMSFPRRREDVFLRGLWSHFYEGMTGSRGHFERRLSIVEEPEATRHFRECRGCLWEIEDIDNTRHPVA